MSSTILPPDPNDHPTDDRPEHEREPGRGTRSAEDSGAKDPFLEALGQRVRTLRVREGLSRTALADATGVSKRHLANLEYGIGNASILILQQVAQALGCKVAGLLEEETKSTEMAMLLELLAGRDETTLRRIRHAVTDLLGTRKSCPDTNLAATPRIALLGMRGAGKSTLGRMLAEDLGYPFVEISEEIEKFAGCSVAEIQALYGQNAYRRYERKAVEECIQIYPEVVIATAGGIVSDLSTFNLLLAHCSTVWLQAKPEDHMRRVVAQGDTRPMAESQEAMDDLRVILASREAFYAKAELHIDTSAQNLSATFLTLRNHLRDMLQLPV